MPPFSADLKRRVRERDGDQCWVCGTDWDIDVHHRAGRGAGGSKAANVMSNCVCACRKHNGMAETDADFMRLAYARGFKVKRHGIRAPADIAIWSTPEQAWFLLSDDGSRLRLTAEALSRYLPDGADNDEGPTTPVGPNA